MIKTHIIGLPTIDKNRKIKFAIEKYIINNSDKNLNIVNKTINNIIKQNIKIQKKFNFNYITIGYHYIIDPISYTLINLGIYPNIYNYNKNLLGVNELINITKGYKNIKPFKMVKWFNSNYHYFIPKLNKKDIKYFYNCNLIKNEIFLTKNNKNIKCSIIGPLTFIKLCNIKNNLKKIINSIIGRYIYLINNIKKHNNIKYIQLEEPIINTINYKIFKKIFNLVYKILYKIKFKTILILNNINIKKYYKALTKNNLLKIISINASKKNILFLKTIKTSQIFSLGIIKGNNIWINNIKKSIKIIKTIKNIKLITTDFSLIHIPFSNKKESFKNKIFTSFAYEKLKELKIIKSILNNKNTLKYKKIIKKNTINYLKFKKEIYKINKYINKNKNIIKKKQQKKQFIKHKKIGIKNLPKTTIGSFPQTNKIRLIRKNFKDKIINLITYNKLIKKEINKTIKIQKKYNIDILVNGEIERNDMVEYFCSNIRGCSITKNGWVQSYATRYVKPAIIWGTIKNKDLITEYWNKHLFKINKNNNKLILTGPITLTKWSFIRNDIKIRKIFNMFSVLLYREIKTSIKRGFKIIQIDEPALKEAMPINKYKLKKYTKNAIQNFRITYKYAKNKNIQIHSHICYSKLNKYDLKLIKSLGVDVITIESARNIKTNINLIKKTKLFNYLELGMGIFDVHSKNKINKNIIKKNIIKLCKNIPINKIWINPDCGLKTKSTKEVIYYLKITNIIIKKLKYSYNIK